MSFRSAPDFRCLNEDSIVADLLGLLELGPRFTGSPAETQARRFVLERLSPLGLALHEDPYDYVGWELDEKPQLEITAPSRLTLDARAFIHSAHTPTGGLRGRLHYLGHLWVIGCFDWMRFAILDDEDRLVGYLSARPDGPAIPQPLDPQSAVVPHFIVGADAFRPLSSWVEEGATVTIEGRVASREGHRASSANIVACYAPVRPSPFRVVVCAHLDSMWGAPGANDNGGGAVGVMALARAISESPLPFAVDFIWFTGEESNLLGSRAYVDRLTDADLGRIRLLLNLDGIAESGEQLHIWSGNESLEYEVLQCLRDFAPPLDRKLQHIYTFPPRPGMDHVPFYERGVTNMVSFTGFEMVRYHTPRDVFRPELGRNTAYATSLAWHLLRNVTTDPSGPIFKGRSVLPTLAQSEADIKRLERR